MYSVTKKKVIELENKFESKRIELEEIRITTIENMWLRELEDLNNTLEEFNSKDNEAPIKAKAPTKSKAVSKAKATTKSKLAANAKAAAVPEAKK